jgi:hypothetical protein
VLQVSKISHSQWLKGWTEGTWAIKIAEESRASLFLPRSRFMVTRLCGKEFQQNIIIIEIQIILLFRLWRHITKKWSQMIFWFLTEITQLSKKYFNLFDLHLQISKWFWILWDSFYDDNIFSYLPRSILIMFNFRYIRSI